VRNIKYPYTCSLPESLRLGGCKAAEKPPVVKDWCAVLNRNPVNDPCALAACNYTFGSTRRIALPGGTPCQPIDGTVDGKCSVSSGYTPGKCVGTAQDANVKIYQLTQPRRTGDGARLEVAVVASSGAVTAVVAHYELAHTEGQATAALSPMSNGGGAWYGATLTGGRAARNVTVVATTADHGTVAVTFRDWGDVTNVNPVVKVTASSPERMTVGVAPIDFIKTATLVTAAGADIVVGAQQAADTVTFSYTAAPTAAVAIRLTMFNGVDVTAQLPCALPADASGDSCTAMAVDVRGPHSKCLHKTMVKFISAWYVELWPLTTPEGLGNVTGVVVINGTGTGGNRTLSLRWRKYTGGVSQMREATVVAVLMADGREELFLLPFPLPVRGDELACVAGVAPPPAALATAPATPTAICIMRECVIDGVYTNKSNSSASQQSSSSADGLTSQQVIAIVVGVVFLLLIIIAIVVVVLVVMPMMRAKKAAEAAKERAAVDAADAAEHDIITVEFSPPESNAASAKEASVVELVVPDDTATDCLSVDSVEY
jgi:hypothetical protein